MRKTYFYPLVGIIILAFIFSFTMSTPLIAQDDSEDVMDMELEDLLNVEITTAGKKAEKVSEIPASVVLVTREEIEMHGYQTLGEILQNIPGLYQTNDYFLKSTGVRGLWTQDANRNMIILVNDVPQREDLYSSSALENMNIPVEAIDRIEVVRGPMSVIYGSGAFFGAINIKTNLLHDGKAVRMIAGAVGSEKTAKVFLRASGKDGDFQYTFNAAIRDTDGMDHPYSDMMTSPAAYGIPNTSTTKDHLESTERFFNFSGKFKEFSLEVSYSDSDRGFNLFLPGLTDGGDSFLRMTRIAFGYNFELSKKVKMDATVNYYHYRRGVSPYDWGDLSIQDDGATAYNVELDLFYDPSPKFSLMLGVAYHNAFEILNSGDLPVFEFQNFKIGPEETITQSIFTQFDYRFSDKFKVVAGIRLEKVPKFDLNVAIFGGLPGEAVFGQTIDQKDVAVVPRFAFIYSMNDKNVLKLLYGKAINRPSSIQYGDNVLAGTSYILKPEEIHTVELNYFGQLSPKFSLSISAFRNILDKLIFNTSFIIDDVYTTYYSNVGKMNTTGVEMTLQAKLSKNFQIDLSGTYQDTKDKRDGFEDIEVGYSPKILGYFKASYLFNKNISLALNGTYVDKMQSYYDSTIPGRLGTEVDSYFLLGANLRFRNLFGKGFFLNIKGSNILDEKVFYPTTNVGPWADKGTRGRAMTFLVTIGKKW